MKSPHVKFVVDQRLDIENHLIHLESYKVKLHVAYKEKNNLYEKLLKLSKIKRRDYYRKQLASYYSAKKVKKIEELRKDNQKYWNKIEKGFFSKVEKVFNKPFPYQGEIKAAFSFNTPRFGYSWEDKWFTFSPQNNKFSAAGTVMHELLHFVFHKYFEKQCKNYGLKWKQIWNIKESFTVLLNLEFSDFVLLPDYGYPEHKEIRNFIAEEWKKNKDFGKVLDKIYRFVASNK